MRAKAPDPTSVAVYLLGAALLLSLSLIGLLAFAGDPGRPIPDVLVATPPTCLAGLLGLLVPRTAGGGEHRREDPA